MEAKGEEIPIGSPMALIVEDEAAYQAFLKLDPSTYANLLGSSADNAETSKKSAENTSSSVADSESSLATGEKPRLSPAARHMAESQSLDISKLRGTSKKGLISKRDLVMGLKDGTVTIQHASRQKDDIASASEQSIQPKEKKQPPSQPSSVAQKIDYAVDSAPINSRYVDIPNSNMRKVIAKRLSESKATVPHFYTTVECEIDELLTLRKALKKDFDVNISVNDLVIKSAAMALRDVPEANAKWNAKTQSVTPSDGVDVSVAVATPNGLITPIVKGASRRGLSDINSTVKDLAGRARLGKLSPEEYQGGSFSISNLGNYFSFLLLSLCLSSILLLIL